MNSLELFSGAGGLEGIEFAGAKHTAFVEWNSDACKTLRHNFLPCIVYETDIRNIDFEQFQNIDLIVGGPPCQPFSIGGKAKGSNDERDMFPYAISAIQKLSPKAFIFENVKGSLRQSFADYFNHIVLQLTYPSIKKTDGSWQNHLSELERIHTKGNYPHLHYNVIYRLINIRPMVLPSNFILQRIT